VSRVFNRYLDKSISSFIASVLVFTLLCPNDLRATTGFKAPVKLHQHEPAAALPWECVVGSHGSNTQASFQKSVFELSETFTPKQQAKCEEYAKKSDSDCLGQAFCRAGEEVLDLNMGKFGKKAERSKCGGTAGGERNNCITKGLNAAWDGLYSNIVDGFVAMSARGIAKLKDVSMNDIKNGTVAAAKATVKGAVWAGKKIDEGATALVEGSVKLWNWIGTPEAEAFQKRATSKLISAGKTTVKGVIAFQQDPLKFAREKATELAMGMKSALDYIISSSLGKQAALAYSCASCADKMNIACAVIPGLVATFLLDAETWALAFATGATFGATGGALAAKLAFQMPKFAKILKKYSGPLVKGTGKFMGFLFDAEHTIGGKKILKLAEGTDRKISKLVGIAPEAVDTYYETMKAKKLAARAAKEGLKATGKIESTIGNAGERIAKQEELAAPIKRAPEEIALGRGVAGESATSRLAVEVPEGVFTKFKTAAASGADDLKIQQLNKELGDLETNLYWKQEAGGSVDASQAINQIEKRIDNIVKESSRLNAKSLPTVEEVSTRIAVVEKSLGRPLSNPEKMVLVHRVIPEGAPKTLHALEQKLAQAVKEDEISTLNKAGRALGRPVDELTELERKTVLGMHYVDPVAPGLNNNRIAGAGNLNKQQILSRARINRENGNVFKSDQLGRLMHREVVGGGASHGDDLARMVNNVPIDKPPSSYLSKQEMDRVIEAYADAYKGRGPVMIDANGKDWKDRFIAKAFAEHLEKNPMLVGGAGKLRFSTRDLKEIGERIAKQEELAAPIKRAPAETTLGRGVLGETATLRRASDVPESVFTKFKTAAASGADDLKIQNMNSELHDLEAQLRWKQAYSGPEASKAIQQIEKRIDNIVKERSRVNAKYLPSVKETSERIVAVEKSLGRGLSNPEKMALIHRVIPEGAPKTLQELEKKLAQAVKDDEVMTLKKAAWALGRPVDELTDLERKTVLAMHGVEPMAPGKRSDLIAGAGNLNEKQVLQRARVNQENGNVFSPEKLKRLMHREAVGGGGADLGHAFPMLKDEVANAVKEVSRKYGNVNINVLIGAAVKNPEDLAKYEADYIHLTKLYAATIHHNVDTRFLSSEIKALKQVLSTPVLNKNRKFVDFDQAVAKEVSDYKAGLASGGLKKPDVIPVVDSPAPKAPILNATFNPEQAEKSRAAFENVLENDDLVKQVTNSHKQGVAPLSVAERHGKLVELERLLEHERGRYDEFKKSIPSGTHQNLKQFETAEQMYPKYLNRLEGLIKKGKEEVTQDIRGIHRNVADIDKRYAQFARSSRLERVEGIPQAIKEAEEDVATLRRILKQRSQVGFEEVYKNTPAYRHGDVPPKLDGLDSTLKDVESHLDAIYKKNFKANAGKNPKFSDIHSELKQLSAQHKIKLDPHEQLIFAHSPELRAQAAKGLSDPAGFVAKLKALAKEDAEKTVKEIEQDLHITLTKDQRTVAIAAHISDPVAKGIKPDLIAGTGNLTIPQIRARHKILGKEFSNDQIKRMMDRGRVGGGASHGDDFVRIVNNIPIHSEGILKEGSAVIPRYAENLKQTKEIVRSAQGNQVALQEMKNEYIRLRLVLEGVNTLLPNDRKLPQVLKNELTGLSSVLWELDKRGYKEFSEMVQQKLVPEYKRNLKSGGAVDLTFKDLREKFSALSKSGGQGFTTLNGVNSLKDSLSNMRKTGFSEGNWSRTDEEIRGLLNDFLGGLTHVESKKAISEALQDKEFVDQYIEMVAEYGPRGFSSDETSEMAHTLSSFLGVLRENGQKLSPEQLIKIEKLGTSNSNMIPVLDIVNDLKKISQGKSVLMLPPPRLAASKDELPDLSPDLIEKLQTYVSRDSELHRKAAGLSTKEKYTQYERFQALKEFRDLVSKVPQGGKSNYDYAAMSFAKAKAEFDQSIKKYESRVKNFGSSDSAVNNPFSPSKRKQVLEGSNIMDLNKALEEAQQTLETFKKLNSDAPAQLKEIGLDSADKLTANIKELESYLDLLHKRKLQFQQAT